MITSMTGFGSIIQTFEQYQIQCEIKCLNNRGIDFGLNLPKFISDKEIEIRNILTQKLERGKIYMNFSVEFAPSYNIRHISIDENTAFSYWNEIQGLAKKLNIPITETSFIQLLRQNEIWKKTENTISDELWEHVLMVIQKAIDKVLQFRIQEGENTAKSLKESVLKVERLTHEITPYETNRIPILKEKLTQILKEYNLSLNEDRLMQELVYYTEKYDIAEEKTRLLHHCQYFLESLESNENNGKKLQFITQEMHREVNTLGVKSNHVEIQKMVVTMKEEIEKMKEQLNNIA
jgi:uncharacterized protein (TIGR00255 family)